MTAPDIERSYISQFSPELVGLIVHAEGVPANADGEVVVAMVNDETASVVFARAATHSAVGTYEVRMHSGETSEPGFYTLTWEYTLNGHADRYQTYVRVGPASPAYDSLTPDMKMIADSVWMRFTDLFDAPEGGPNLQVYLESKFGRGRIAQLMKIAVGVLNTASQPFSSFSLDGVGMKAFPTAQWGPLLEQSTYIQVLKHLRRSYVEQPMFMGGEITRLDRRDYLQRWGEILQDEEEQFKRQLETFKISNMRMGTPRVLVSGGVYGKFAPTRAAGSIAARPRYWSRFY